jgi:ADP-heptose:LPS heptosyltransferase
MSARNPFQPGLLSRLPEAPRKVALLRASRIGDFICATPAFRALRNALPEAEITIITLPLLRDIALRLPYFDRYMPFPGYPGIAEQLFDARQTVQVFQAMQAERFDLAVQMQGTGMNSNPFCLLLGARATAGFIRPGDPPGLLDAALPYPQSSHEIHTVLSLSTFLGAPSLGDAIEFPLRREDFQTAEALIQGVKLPLIGLHPAARDATRRWMLDRFAATGSELQRRHGGTVLILGEAEEQSAGEQIARRIAGPCLNLIGKTSLVTLGALITHLSVFITNDTGPAHIAYALGAPTVTIFGGGSPLLNGPLQHGPFRVLAHEVPCRPCGYQTCPIGYVCLDGVKVEHAVEVASEIMRQ